MPKNPRFSTNFITSPTCLHNKSYSITAFTPLLSGTLRQRRAPGCHIMCRLPHSPCTRHTHCILLSRPAVPIVVRSSSAHSGATPEYPHSKLVLLRFVGPLSFYV